MGLFSGLFDYNGDGKLDEMEKAAGMATMLSIMDELDSQNEQEELKEVGLDMDELETMDEDERREALEDAGLDPDDYDEF